MPDIEKIIRAFERQDIGNPRRIQQEPDANQSDTVTFTFTAGAQAQKNTASYSESFRFYMKKRAKERKRA